MCLLTCCIGDANALFSLKSRTTCQVISSRFVEAALRRASYDAAISARKLDDIFRGKTFTNGAKGRF